MSAKTILILCAEALLAQCVFSQCTSRAAVDASGIAGPVGWAGPGYAGPGLAGPAFGSALACDGVASPFGYGGRWTGEAIYPAILSALEFTPTSGGAFAVSSASPVPPTGISIVSENAYEGLLEVVGELPFVGTTVVDGVLPSYGAGAINHGCGSGINAMTALSETSTPASVATPSGFGVDAYAVPAAVAPALAYDTPCGSGYAYDGLAYGAPLEGLEITGTSGGSLPVSSASAVPPTGIIVSSETAYEGPLAITGELPFVGTVGMDGIVPTTGLGAVNHACGNGINAMVSETTAFGPGYVSGIYGPTAGIAPTAAIAPGVGCANRWAGRGFGRAF